MQRRMSHIDLQYTSNIPVPAAVTGKLLLFLEWQFGKQCLFNLHNPIHIHMNRAEKAIYQEMFYFNVQRAMFPTNMGFESVLKSFPST